MQWFILLLASMSFLVPHTLAAESVTRRDGFLLLWESIRRPAAETREAPYADLSEGERGFTEITYAKSRGLLEDAETFLPDAPLTKGDAALWLLRTRNVAELEEMEEQDLPVLLARYPILRADELGEPVGSIDMLRGLADSLDRFLREEVHEVSFYAEQFHGEGTAFGETFDMHALTAAHRTFPYNTLVRVTNVENGKSVTVRVNDRGPYVEGRSMDLSLAAFLQIAERSQGVLRDVRLERLGDADFVDADSMPLAETPAPVRCGSTPDAPVAFQKRITRDVRFHRGVPHTLLQGETLVLGSTRFFVVRSVLQPDGSVRRLEQWIDPEERFTFHPEQVGRYVLRVGTADGRVREFTMDVWSCNE